MSNPTHKARDIIQEALDTIKATYWIAGQEVSFASAINRAEPEQSYDRVQKAIEAKVVQEIYGTYVPYGKDKAKVTGVCSIGALALANVTLYDIPLNTYSEMAARDLQTWLAGAAVANAILAFEARQPASKRCEENVWGDCGGNASGVIAHWNDEEERKRAHVIRVFTDALEDPILRQKFVWRIRANFHSQLPASFVTKKAAKAFITTNSRQRKHMLAYYLDSDDMESTYTEAWFADPANWTIEKYNHEGLVAL